MPSLNKGDGFVLLLTAKESNAKQFYCGKNGFKIVTKFKLEPSYDFDQRNKLIQ